MIKSKKLFNVKEKSDKDNAVITKKIYQLVIILFNFSGTILRNHSVF